ncbi:hypothetical protein B0J13DRAFT_539118 [Dactylonectria estremocensis]|uniref:NYN domain-containing protein n=1 Tax=Dactylonectria estremocensis TaxID=1079267 RepID=A0A9P9FEA9_9HYPO|nr:hypothetical protein B0J13DRAFT_539118 [Dactylonectria estremocensis]
MMSTELRETCIFFVDDSNIWIEAQKFAALGNKRVPKLADGDRDPRLRIDIGRLIDTLRKDRSQGSSFLYGSRPPPNDLVWKAFEKFQFETKIYDRAHGKEKEVDNSMATDLSVQATTLKVSAQFDRRYEQVKAHTTFVVITGDRDMLPPVKHVLQSKIKVELWAWESGISNEYLKLVARHGLLSVNYLDEIFEDISFTAFHSTRKCTEVDGGQTIVLSDLSDLSEAEGDIEAEGIGKGKDKGKNKLVSVVGEQLLQLGRLFFITPSQTGHELFIEFPEAKDIDAIISKVRQKQAEGVISNMKVLSWLVYNSRPIKNSPALVATSNKYELLADNTGRQSTSAAVKKDEKPAQITARPWSSIAELRGQQVEQGEAPNDEPWETVSRRGAGKTHSREARKEQRCPSGLRCEKARDCGFQHTEQERNLFRELPNQRFGRWKTKMCVAPYCHRGRRCPFAHTQEEAWCLRCSVEGHSMEVCPYTIKKK